MNRQERRKDGLIFMSPTVHGTEKMMTAFTLGPTRYIPHPTLPL